MTIRYVPQMYRYDSAKAYSFEYCDFCDPFFNNMDQLKSTL